MTIAVIVAAEFFLISGSVFKRFGVLNDKGASLLDGYMEDLATDRIYRLMIAQRVKHSEVVGIKAGIGG